MKNILITGGYGFMGSNFIRYLYQKYPEYRIFNLDLLTYAGNVDNLFDIEESEANLKAVDRRYQFIYGDIADDRLLDMIFQRHNFQLVVNFAAETHVDRSIISMTDFIHTNIGGARALIEAVRTYSVPRLIHISTDEIYGSVDSGHSDEEAPLRPSNPYSSSKSAADLIVQSFIRTHKVPALIVRASNNYGSFQYPEKLIPLAISNILEKRKIPVHGKGEHVRSWLHVMDFCRALDLIIHQAPDFEIYNISGEEKTNLEILRIIAEHLNVDLIEHSEHVGDRPGADTRYAVNADKLKNNLGWQPIHSIKNDLGQIVRWYIDNQAWWKKIKERKEYQDHYQKQSKAQWY